MASSFTVKWGIISAADIAYGHNSLNTMPFSVCGHFDWLSTDLQSSTSAATGSSQSKA